MKDSYDDFRHDERLHSKFICSKLLWVIVFLTFPFFFWKYSLWCWFVGEITRVFGLNTLEYLKGLIDGHIDYLPRMPDKLLIHMIVFLPLEDIIRLSMVSKQFHRVRHVLAIVNSTRNGLVLITCFVFCAPRTGLLSIIYLHSSNTTNYGADLQQQRTVEADLCPAYGASHLGRAGNVGRGDHMEKTVLYQQNTVTGI